ncbi:MAG: short chain dehydrogenase [Burkholderiales bacterium]|nr:short chain dehydrogenase [Burkholderiales bacterium]
MKILLVGNTGTIGAAVQQLLMTHGHQVLGASHHSGQYRIDLSDPASIKTVLAAAGQLDAIVCTAGLANFGHLASLHDADFQLGLRNKLMGQINLLRLGQDFLHDHGSVTLTSGVLAQHPMTGSAVISMVNAGLEGFTRAAALELPRGLRINTVSPVFVTETAAIMGMDTGNTLSAADTAKAYLSSVEGAMNGQILDARAYA